VRIYPVKEKEVKIIIINSSQITTAEIYNFVFYLEEGKRA
jgi:hypothetical protein